MQTQTESTWPPRIDSLVESLQKSNRFLKNNFNAGSWQNPSSRGMHFVISKIEKCCSFLHKSNDVRWMRSAFEDYIIHYYNFFKSDEMLHAFDSVILKTAKTKEYHQKYDQVIEFQDQKIVVGFTKTHKGVFIFALNPLKSI